MSVTSEVTLFIYISRHFWDPATNQHIAGSLPGYDGFNLPISVSITSGDENWKQFVSITGEKLRVFGVNTTIPVCVINVAIPKNDIYIFISWFQKTVIFLYML